jgi:DNA-binding NarL/FixJ family response regulator
MRADSKQWHVLIVDDYPAFRETVRTVLDEDPRFVVVAEASSGEEAIEVARQFEPDLVLMDLRLPGMNGLTAATAIKSRQPQVIILILSGDWSAAYERKARAAGVSAHLAKQRFNLGEIYRVLQFSVP